MAINFPNSPSNGDTHTAGGKTFTYDATAGVWNSSGSGVTEFTGLSDTPSTLGTAGQIAKVNSGGTAFEFADQSGVTVYATIDLLPGAADAGDLAFVTATNRLYIWNGSGWYNIALINTNPTISGVSSSYVLASDGTPTTVTITATDPEGIPITYSIASDTSGNIATVSQGTGSNSNVFTITPSTNSANAGTFSLTFRASDGVNIASSVAQFTLQFSIANSKYTSLLLTTNGSTGGNTTFTDSSSNSYTITPAGTPRQSTFSPYRSGGYSTYFDGSGDYLEIPNAAGNAASDTFTVEFWIKDPEVVSGSAPLYTQGTGSSNAAFAIDYTSAGAIRVDYYGNSITHTVNLADGAWHHIAVTLDGYSRARKLWLDGSLVASDSNTSGAFSASNCVIGRMPWASRVYKGYMRDFRISDNIRYSATFTPPEEPLVSDSNTKILTCHLPYFADGSTNNHTITPNGNVSTQPFGPYDYQSEYTVGTHGGSAYFYGTSDLLSLPTAAGNLGTGDFTVELWAYHDDATLGGQTYIDTRETSATNGWLLYVLGGGDYIRFYANGSSTVLSPTTAIVRKNAWNHIAISRASGTLRLFVNGVQHGAQTGNTSDYAAYNFNIGAKTYTASSAIPMKGDIADVRISTNARYTADFTPPTTAFTNDSNTQLLVSMQDTAIIDKSQTTTRAILVGNTTASTAQYKYLPSSIYFDGTDDGIRIPMASGVGATARLPGSFAANEDFTIEMWHYLTARTELYPCLFSNHTTYGTGSLSLYAGHNNVSTTQYALLTGGGSAAINAGTINYNQWVHVALVRSSGTITLYIDGTSVGTTSNSGAFLGSGSWMGIGLSQETSSATSINGYLSDVRITKGLARYTANFTPPTAALQG